MSPPFIYFDHNATTPVHPEVAQAMQGALTTCWGNPSSIHAVGRHARAAVENARAEVAALIGGATDEVVFTSGGTEGDNLAILGLVRAVRTKRGAQAPAHVISSPLEHPAVAGALAVLQQEGVTVTLLPVAADGTLDPAALTAALRDETVLVSLALANHEIGTLHPIAQLAAITRPRGILFHTDAVQAAGRVPVDVAALGVDALTLSAHKIGGPKGTGAVWIRRGLLPTPLVNGGHQEHERRGGTENVAGIVGFGTACRLSREALSSHASVTAALRDRLETQLLKIPGSIRHGTAMNRVPGTTNIGFADTPGELVVIGLDLEGVAVSTGAACSSGTPAPSPVLLALGLSAAKAREAVRFSLGSGNTASEVDRVAALVTEVVARVRAAA